jgi:hypothetical protein
MIPSKRISSLLPCFLISHYCYHYHLRSTPPVTATVFSGLSPNTFTRAGTHSKTSRMHFYYSTSSTETTRKTRVDEGSQILEVEELTECRYGGVSHLGISVFQFLSVGTLSSSNGICTGFTISRNQGNWRCSFTVLFKVNLEGIARSWDFCNCTSVYVGYFIHSACT